MVTFARSVLCFVGLCVLCVVFNWLRFCFPSCVVFDCYVSRHCLALCLIVTLARAVSCCV